MSSQTQLAYLHHIRDALRAVVEYTPFFETWR